MTAVIDTPDTAITDAKTALATKQAAGLRALAACVEQNPEMAAVLSYTLDYSGINAHLERGDKAEQQGRIARIALRHGAKVTKDISDQFHNLLLDFGGVKVDVLARRNEVCDRVVTGVETVEEEVPDPVALAAVPTVKQTKEVEKVEWVCRAVLAAETASAETSPAVA